ncbi:MAG: lysophospholipase [Actinomycetota bacterium]|nr:lysophospholipase [Actinomycetota bacterium]
MSNEPVLRVVEPPGTVHGVALVLHGGRSNGYGRVRSSQLAVLRMLPFARALRAKGAADGLAVARLRYGARGWNGAAQSPVADARWTLEELDRRYPGIPIGLVGHSMGGRTAMYVADHPNVSPVVGLAPWLEPGDPVRALSGRRVLIAHGSLDRMTSAGASAEFAARAATVAASMSYVNVSDERHAMLRRASVWHDLAAGFVTAVLFDRPPEGTADARTTNVLLKALAGEPSLVV